MIKMYDFDDDDIKTLNKTASKDNASESDILKAALANTQEQYKELSECLIAEMRDTMSDFDTRLKAIETAITQSNREKDINIVSALESASETIIGQMRGKFDEFDRAIDKRIKKLEEAQLEADSSTFKFTAIIVAILILAFGIGGYFSNYLYGKWYEIPQKIDAINNGMYELLNPPKEKPKKEEQK